jgi:hypothetical protein
MAYLVRVDNSGSAAVSEDCTLQGRRDLSCTASVHLFCASLLTAGLTVGWPSAIVGADQAAGRAHLLREQAAGWLELRRDQRLYRERLGREGAGTAPEAAANLGLMERQEELDRRALDWREAQWLDDARRRHNLPGSVGPSPAPALRLRIERAEASERLRRDLRRQTLGPRPTMAPISAPPPFRLR